MNFSVFFLICPQDLLLLASTSGDFVVRARARKEVQLRKFKFGVSPRWHFDSSLVRLAGSNPDS